MFGVASATHRSSAPHLPHSVKYAIDFWVLSFIKSNIIAISKPHL